MNCSVNADFPTPPEPTIIILYTEEEDKAGGAAGGVPVLAMFSSEELLWLGVVVGSFLLVDYH
jgi:hypothetical protein